MIGGNITAVLQVKDEGKKNAIGERDHVWKDALELKGWLDYQGGQNSLNTFDAKVQETTHIFMCDFKQLSTKWQWNPFNLVSGVSGVIDIQDEKIDLTSENARMVVNGIVYNILMVDDPMGMHKHLEIYLKYVGGGLGV